MIRSTIGIIASSYNRGYEPEAQAFFDYYGFDPLVDLAQMNLWNAFVRATKADGSWSYIASLGLYPMIGSTQAKAIGNAAFPGANELVVDPGYTYSQALGFSGDGSVGNYIGTGINLKNDIASGGMHMSIVVDEVPNAASFNIMGAYDTVANTRTSIGIGDPNSSSYNKTRAQSWATSTAGWIVNSTRSSGNYYKTYVNGTQVATTTTADYNDQPDSELFIGSMSIDGAAPGGATYQGNIQFASAGLVLLQGNVNSIWPHLNTLLTGLGRG